MIYLMPSQWGYVGILDLPLSGGPTGPYLDGVPCHKIKKKNKRSYHFAPTWDASTIRESAWITVNLEVFDSTPS